MDRYVIEDKLERLRRFSGESMTVHAVVESEADIEALDRTALGKVKRLAGGNAVDDVEQDDVAQFLLCGKMGEGSADIAGADKGDLLASHDGKLSFTSSGDASDKRRPASSPDNCRRRRCKQSPKAGKFILQPRNEVISGRIGVFNQ